MEYRGHGRWELKRLPRAPKSRMRKIAYKPEYDDPPVKRARKKPVRRKKTTANTKSVARPKKKLPKMKRGWFW